MTTTVPTSTITVRIEKLAHARGLDLPAYETAGAAGLDLKAAIPAKFPITIAPGARVLIPTGFKIELPSGFEAQVRPRSGLALKHGLTVLNTPGTIDSDYRGEVGVILINHGSEPYVVRRGDRIAQMVISPVTTAHSVKVTSLSETARGTGGFGSTKVAGSTRPKRELKKKNPPQRRGRK